jgi:hypothetical protein
MKNIYPFFIVLALLFSCKTQNQQTANDSASVDTVVSKEKPSTVDTSVQFCGELVKEILKSSPRYKQLTSGLLEAVKKNGGTSVDIMIDKSPEHNKKDASEYSANYEMQISESYPDRQVNLAHFSFNPSKGELYEYDVVRDQLITIDFDKELLGGAGRYCK